MKGVRAALVLCFLATSLYSAENEHVLFGKPVGGYSINHVGYSCGYRAKMGCSAWVSYHLKPEYFGQERLIKSAPQLYSDPAIISSGLNAPTPDDLRDSSLTPLFFFSHDNALGRGKECEKEVYSLVNVGASRGTDTMPKVWRDLDAATRQWAQEFKEIWVITGPIFAAEPERTVSRKMAIPNEFYKIVARKDGDTIKAIAFRIPQDASGNINQFLASILDIEKQTDLEFFPALPRDQRKALKATTQPMWELTGAKDGSAPGKSSDLAAKSAKGSDKGLTKGPDKGGDTAAPESGKSAPAAGGGDGKVWVLGDVYYSSGAKQYGKGNGTFMGQEEAGLLGFKPAN